MLEWKHQPIQPQQKFMCRLMNTLLYLRQCTLQKFGSDLSMACIPFLEKFHTVNNFHQNIKFIMGQESNGELSFLDTLLKRDNGKISVLVHRKPTHSDQYLYCSFHHQTGCKGIVVSSFFFFFFFSIWVFFYEHSRITGLQGKGEGISLTPHYHFHPFHRHLHISRAITAESSPLHIASSRT